MCSDTVHVSVYTCKHKHRIIWHKQRQQLCHFHRRYQSAVLCVEQNQGACKAERCMSSQSVILFPLLLFRLCNDEKVIFFALTKLIRYISETSNQRGVIRSDHLWRVVFEILLRHSCQLAIRYIRPEKQEYS